MSSEGGFDDQNFLHLKKALEQCGYSQPLGLETTPLVHALFTDLIELNKNNLALKEQFDAQAEELGLARTQVSCC